MKRFGKRPRRLGKLLALVLGLSLVICAGIAGNFFLRLTKIAPAPDAAFHWPYYLYKPARIQSNRNTAQAIHLLVLPNNTGTTDDDPVAHDLVALFTVLLGQMVRGNLDVAILVPVFPRPEEHWQVYTQALDRDSLTTDIPDLQRLDLQLEAMIDHALDQLTREGWAVERKVLMMGFSASGMFTNRFAVLHPDRVLAAAIGSPGGWPIAPIPTWEGQDLRYPIGVSDLAKLTGTEFDLDTFKAIPLLFFIGDQDTNDSVPYPDSYEDQDRGLVYALFGETPVERWDTAASIYTTAGAYADFRLYAGVDHTITVQEFADIRSFFAKVLEGEP